MWYVSPCLPLYEWISPIFDDLHLVSQVLAGHKPTASSCSLLSFSQVRSGGEQASGNSCLMVLVWFFHDYGEPTLGMAIPSFLQVTCWQVREEPGWALPWLAWPLSQKAGLLMKGGCRELKGGAGRTVGCQNPLHAAAPKVTEEQKVADTAEKETFS